ncbi:serine hydrolase domain-containing protein [Stenotrophomonas muris]|uniref:serine hydrolase domain-containing protein n=1 Tax=Stenotrophomonas muris TaxID=2963283 RepID=UPI000259B939|nr:Beta-lactamase class C and other penicillin binding proteins [Stenotrophomonas maltophilia D457]
MYHDPVRRRLCAALLATGCGLSAPSALASRATLAGCGSLTALLQAERQPGMAAVLVDHGRIAALSTTGRLNDTRPAPIDRHTVFELGSITKLFTALLIFRLQQRHLLDVTAPIGQYVEGLPSVWASTSLLQLLSHTSGIPNYLNEDNFLRLMPTNPAPRELLAEVAERPLAFAPGARHAYSNTNYILLGLAIEHATGMDYWRVLQEEILSPLGMRDAGPRRADDRRRVAQGHLFQDGHWRAPPPTAPGSAWAAGGLLASIDDMARFAVALDQHRLLPESALKRMWCDTLLANGSKAGWGGGWEVSDGGKVVGHGGGTAGFTGYLRHRPTDRRTLVVLINRAGDINPQGIAERLDLGMRGCNGRLSRPTPSLDQPGTRTTRSVP